MDCKILRDDVRDIISNSLIGLTSTNQEVTQFDFANVVVAKSYFEDESVRIISGTSHSFAEFVGKGMLTASVQGEDFIAPCSKVILRTIRELCLKHVNGVLIIVPANSGNLFNFGLATERALNDNLRVKLLAISDDVANDNMPKTCKRGLSGVILVNKIAGAMSEKGNCLIKIYMFCSQVVKNIRSTAVSLKEYEKPDSSTCICNREISSESRETTKKQRDFEIAQTLTRQIVKELINSYDLRSEPCKAKLTLRPDDNIVILMNNSCGMSKTEELVFVKEFLVVFSEMACHVQRFYVGNFFRVSPRIDITVTVLKVCDRSVLEYLDHPCTAPGWRRVNQGISECITLEHKLGGKLKRKERLAPPIRGPKISERLANVLLFSLQFACDALISCEKQLNLIDREMSDGDTGTRLKNASEVLLKRIKTEKIITNYPFTFFEGISKILEATLGGTLGCIYSILFEAAANSFCEYTEEVIVTPYMWLAALDRAAASLSRYGNVDYGDNTMYDPIHQCALTVREELDSGSDFVEAFGRGVSKAEEVAQRTKRSYGKYPDSGAHAVGIWMRAVFEGVKLRCPVD